MEQNGRSVAMFLAVTSVLLFLAKNGKNSTEITKTTPQKERWSSGKSYLVNFHSLKLGILNFDFLVGTRYLTHLSELNISHTNVVNILTFGQ